MVGSTYEGEGYDAVHLQTLLLLLCIMCGGNVMPRIFQKKMEGVDGVVNQVNAGRDIT